MECVVILDFELLIPDADRRREIRTGANDPTVWTVREFDLLEAYGCGLDEDVEEGRARGEIVRCLRAGRSSDEDKTNDTIRKAAHVNAAYHYRMTNDR